MSRFQAVVTEKQAGPSRRGFGSRRRQTVRQQEARHAQGGSDCLPASHPAPVLGDRGTKSIGKATWLTEPSGKRVRYY